jgi:putative tricarboxylic transport membrane protein
MMGGLLIWGLQPGPLLFVEQREFVWGLIASMYVANVIAVASCWRRYASVLRIPFAIVGPLIVVSCLIGAYTVSSSLFDVVLALLFGVLGYVFKKLDYPVAPLVLGDRAETSFRQSMIFSGGSLAIFWSNGIAATLSTLALLLAASPLLGRWRRARQVP